MSVLGIHLADLLVLVVYFGLVLYLGVFLGAKKTRECGHRYCWGSRRIRSSLTP